MGVVELPHGMEYPGGWIMTGKKISTIGYRDTPSC
jgi:hypothetical protein